MCANSDSISYYTTAHASTSLAADADIRHRVDADTTRFLLSQARGADTVQAAHEAADAPRRSQGEALRSHGLERACHRRWQQPRPRDFRGARVEGCASSVCGLAGLV